MVQTLDFLPYVWKSKSIEDELMGNIYSHEKEIVNIGVHQLKFDFANGVVTITCNDPEYIFKWKMVPLEMTLETLENLIKKDFDNKNNKMNFK